MKELIAFITILAFSGFSQEAPNAKASQAPQLYLHFLTPGVGGQANGGQSRQYLQTLTTKISLGEDFDVRVDDGLEYISGRIEDRGGKMYAHLRSHYVSTTCDFDGTIEAEKKYYAGKDGGGFSGGIFLSYLVVSTNADSKPFAQADIVWKTNTVSK